MSTAPTIYRNEDGTVRLEWNDDVRARWYDVSPEIIEQMVETHNDLIAERERSALLLGETLTLKAKLADILPPPLLVENISGETRVSAAGSSEGATE